MDSLLSELTLGPCRSPLKQRELRLSLQSLTWSGQVEVLIIPDAACPVPGFCASETAAEPSCSQE